MKHIAVATLHMDCKGIKLYVLPSNAWTTVTVSYFVQCKHTSFMIGNGASHLRDKMQSSANKNCIAKTVTECVHTKPCCRSCVCLNAWSFCKCCHSLQCLSIYCNAQLPQTALPPATTIVSSTEAGYYNSTRRNNNKYSENKERTITI